MFSTYGTVYSGILNGVELAVKRINKPEYLKHLLTEVDIMARMQHPNLMTCIGTDHHCAFVMPRAKSNMHCACFVFFFS